MNALPGSGSPFIQGGLVQSVRGFMILLLLMGPGCRPHDGPAAVQTPQPVSPRVFVTSDALFWMTSEVGGDEVMVQRLREVRISGSETPEDWTPAQDDIRDMQAAQLILLHGAGHEPWISRISLPESRVVDTSQGYQSQVLRTENAIVHQHGPEGGFDASGLITATWLDPELARAQLQSVVQALSRLKPECAEQFAARSRKPAQGLESANAALLSLAERTPPAGITVVGDSSAWQYLTRRLNWTLRVINWPEEPAPGDSDADHAEPNSSDMLAGESVQRLRSLGQELPGSLILLRANRPESAAKLAESVGLVPVSIDLCEGISNTEASLDVRIKENIARLASACTQCEPAGVPVPDGP